MVITTLLKQQIEWWLLHSTVCDLKMTTNQNKQNAHILQNAHFYIGPVPFHQKYFLSLKIKYFIERTENII